MNNITIENKISVEKLPNNFDRLSPEQAAEIRAMLTLKIAPIVDGVKSRYKLFNRRFSARDFYRICRAEKIEICNTAAFAFMTGQTQVLGCLMHHKNGVKSIWLRSFFEGELGKTPGTLTIAAHELGHFFCGHKGGNPSDLLLKRSEQADPIARDIRELEADLFSDLLLRV